MNMEIITYVRYSQMTKKDFTKLVYIKNCYGVK